MHGMLLYKLLDKGMYSAGNGGVMNINFGPHIIWLMSSFYKAIY